MFLRISRQLLRRDAPEFRFLFEVGLHGAAEDYIRRHPGRCGRKAVGAGRVEHLAGHPATSVNEARNPSRRRPCSPGDGLRLRRNVVRMLLARSVPRRDRHDVAVLSEADFRGERRGNIISAVADNAPHRVADEPSRRVACRMRVRRRRMFLRIA